MCGLIAVFSKKNKSANQYALDLYKKQASRGRSGFGFLAIHNGKLIGVHRAKDESTIKTALLRERADTILFHHRFPTSTDNSIGTTHPIFVSHEELECDYYLAHNGVITNPTTLKTKHNELGYAYNTEHSVYQIAEFADGMRVERLTTPVVKFNDSESLAIEFARYVEGLTSEIGTNGAVAFWAVSLEKGTNNVIDVYFGKNKGRDLCKINTNKWLVVTSETGKDIEAMVLNKVDINTRTISEFTLEIDEAKPYVAPATTNAYGYHIPASTYEKHVLPDDEQAILIKGKEYSSQDVRDSGHPFSHFTSFWRNNVMVYEPNRFHLPKETQSLDWPALPEKTEEEPNNKHNVEPKILERLESLASEFAVAKVKIMSLENDLGEGIIDYWEYKQGIDRCERDVSLAEDLAFSLGVPDELVNELLDTALEMEEYNLSYVQDAVIVN